MDEYYRKGIPDSAKQTFAFRDVFIPERANPKRGSTLQWLDQSDKKAPYLLLVSRLSGGECMFSRTLAQP